MERLCSWSRQNCAEYERVLLRPHFAQKYGLTPEEIGAFLVLIATAAHIVTPVATLPVAVRDPKDEPVLATALGGRADYLVTGDQDLLVLDGTPELGTLRVIAVREFLAILESTERAN
jgi:putative PIN family toxin of toxin-antitoxin system